MTYLENTITVFENIDEIRKNSGCISDRILNYVQFGLNRLEKNNDIKLTKTELLWLDMAYGEIRMERAEKGQITVKITHEEPHYSWRKSETYVTEHTAANPIGIAASLVYAFCIYCGHSITQQDLADIYGISTPSVRVNYEVTKQFLTDRGLK